MQETWQAFCGGMDGAVRAALDKSRSPPEIAYAIGELVHNYFRTRGVTLTSFELRRLVAEVLDLQQAGTAEPPLVVFTAEPASRPRTAMDGRRTPPRRRRRRARFGVQAPPSPLVELPVRDAVSFDGAAGAGRSRRPARALAAGLDRRVDRAAARGAIDAAWMSPQAEPCLSADGA